MIVDTSIWIEYFKDTSGIVEVMEKGLMDNNIYIVGPVVSELLQGVKTEKEYNELKNCIDAVPYIKGRLTDWKRAGKISFKLRRSGTTIPLTDIYIAALAVKNNFIIFTRDKHFKEIPEIDLFQEFS